MKNRLPLRIFPLCLREETCPSTIPPGSAGGCQAAFRWPHSALLARSAGSGRLEFVAHLGNLSVMRLGIMWLIVFVSALATVPGSAATGRLIKVLPEYLDAKGRTSVSPSLYDRDAYQAVLRQHPERRSGIRYYVQWKIKGHPSAPLKAKVELRGPAQGKLPKHTVLEETLPAKTGWFGHWVGLTLSGDAYRQFGGVVAWRVTLWEGTNLLAEQRSFLW